MCASEKMPKASTPQFRTLLIRRLKNVYPGWTFDLCPEKDGISFQIIDATGAPQGARVRLFDHHENRLERREIVRATGIDPAAEPSS